MSLSQIVIGIDFGTTHSGVSWAVKTREGTPNIRVINDWPNPKAQNATSDKVPTTISYLDGRPHRWGYQTGPQEQTFKWFKILLQTDHQYERKIDHVKSASKFLEATGKTPEEIVGDYLNFLWIYTKEDISRHQGDNWEEIYSTHVVVTVPAIWNETAKERTLRAAKTAGISGNISLVYEPEAAALAVLHAKASEEGIQTGDTFVVCDAGGGTVDLISYMVNGLDPLRIQEKAKGSGGLCGSVYLDIEFEKHIIALVGKSQYENLRKRDKVKMMQDFEYNIKRCFSGNSGNYTVDMPGVADNPELGIDDDEVTLDRQGLKSMFDLVCNQIQNLVEKQIEDVQDNNGRVKAVLLVGGFGSSKYLYNHLAACQRSSGIRVLQSTNAWSAICRGATEWGLEHVDAIRTSPHRTNLTVTSRLSRYSYGYSVMTPFENDKHLLSDLYYDRVEGVNKAKNQMRWLLKRGQEIEDGAEVEASVYHSIQVGFWDNGERPFEKRLLFSADETPPTRVTDSVRELCSVNYAINCNDLWLEKSFKSPVDKKKYRNAYFKLVMKLGTNIEFRVFYKEKLAASCSARPPKAWLDLTPDEDSLTSYPLCFALYALAQQVRTWRIKYRLGGARWLPLFVTADVSIEIIYSVLRSAALEKEEDEDFENRWCLVQHPNQQAVAKPSIAPAKPFQNGFLDATVEVLQDYVSRRCGEDGLGHDDDVYMDWLADDAFGVIDARIAQDNTILFCVRENVDAIQEAEIRLAWNKGTRSDEILSKFIKDAGDIDDQDIMFLVESLAIDKDDSGEASAADLEIGEAKQKINDWIDLEQQRGKPRWFEIRMIVENAMKNSYGISNIGPAAVLTEMKDEFDEDGVMRY
ncbi:hypothetical protein KCU71_g11127, partial [Aureobasidium melanogenum]